MYIHTVISRVIVERETYFLSADLSAVFSFCFTISVCGAKNTPDRQTVREGGGRGGWGGFQVFRNFLNSLQNLLKSMLVVFV